MTLLLVKFVHLGDTPTSPCKLHAQTVVRELGLQTTMSLLWQDVAHVQWASTLLQTLARQTMNARCVKLADIPQLRDSKHSTSVRSVKVASGRLMRACLLRVQIVFRENLTATKEKPHPSITVLWTVTSVLLV